jgi:hypothetical protein
MNLPPWGLPNRDHIATMAKNQYADLVQPCVDALQWIVANPLYQPDLKRLAQLRTRLDQTVPYGPTLFGKPMTHLDLFAQEDKTKATYEAVIRHFMAQGTGIDKADVMTEVFSYNPLILAVKYALERPRPHQVARILGLDLQHEEAVSAASPSLPSGHAFQGLMLGLVVYRRNPTFFAQHPDQLELLVDVCTDVGVRRSMAGLHFVMDNYASLRMVVKVAKHNGWNVTEYIERTKKAMSAKLLG